ncbi:hypothetical protein ACJJTC_006349 [Scirpophaga incertulas]
MQKLFLVLFSACVLVKVAFAAVALLPPQEKPEEFACEEGCYVPALNEVVVPNVRYSPDPSRTGCLQYLCNDSGITQIFSCGAVAAAEPCKVVDGNKTAPYPDCCRTIYCPPKNPSDLIE